MSTEQQLTENPITVVHELLLDWLEENEATDFDENDVAHLFGMLGTAGYSIVPNATMCLADAGLTELSKVVDTVCAPHAGYDADYRQQAAAIEQLETLWASTIPSLLTRLQTAEARPAVDEERLAKFNEDVLYNLKNGTVLVQHGVSWVTLSQATKVLGQLTQAGTEVLAKLRAIEADVAKVYEVVDKEFDTHHRDSQSNCTPEQAQFYTNCEGAIAMLRMHLEKVVPEPAQQ